jgi:MFS family permease
VSNTETLAIFSLFYVGVACSALLDPVVVKRFKTRESFLLLWTFIGVWATVSLLFMRISMPLSAFAIAFFVGFSTGIGLPSCLAYFADHVKVENRGKIGGVAWAIAGIGTLLLATLSLTANTTVEILMLTVLRAVGLLFFLFRPKTTSSVSKTDSSYSSILTDSRILLYLVPWVTFCLINWIESPIVENLFGKEFFSFVTFVEFAVSGLFAFLGGLLSDLVGRKRIIITGFVMLGIEYAVLSFMEELTISRYIYILLDGITWGLFAVVFFIVLWGDLGESGTQEKYYVVGGLPYLLATFLQIFIRQYVESTPLNAAAFSLASFFLFLAVLPLTYAHETLPEKKIKERELKGYIEKAKKTKEKYG